MKLENRIAIVTGGAGGMGQSGAILFAREGAKVAVVDLNEAAAAVTAEMITKQGGRAIAVGADVTRAADVQLAVDRTIAELGLPTVLFNNAGVDLECKRKITEVDEVNFDRTVEVNLKGVWLMMKFVVPAMREARGGSIINTASISAFKAGNTAGYAGAKAGVVAMTRVAAIELGKDNIRVNALCPGATFTPMAQKMRKEAEARGIPYDPAATYRISAFGRMADADEMAKMALFLASEDSSFATGVPFINDGGWMSFSGIEQTYA